MRLVRSAIFATLAIHRRLLKARGRLALLPRPTSYYRASSVYIDPLLADLCYSSDASDMLNLFPYQNATPVKTLHTERQPPPLVTLSAASTTSFQPSEPFRFPFLDELAGLR